MSRLLTHNPSVRAFDHWVPNWEEELAADSLVKSFTLTFADSDAKDGGVEPEVSAISWNANGSVIGVAFGSRNHSTWCSDHKGERSYDWIDFMMVCSLFKIQFTPTISSGLSSLRRGCDVEC